MTYKTRQAASMFEKLKVQRTRTNHHIKGHVITDFGEKLWPPIYFNKGGGDLPIRISEKMRRNLYLSKDDFHQLITCKMSRSEYLELRRCRP